MTARPVSRAPSLRAFLGHDEVVADNFAGGGGASTGLEIALGRSPDVAVNHDPEAIAMHAINHPETRHYISSVWDVDPVEACGGKPCAAAWFSPDCKHFSKAKGGKPRNQKIRGLAWLAVRWAAAVAPRVIFLENVEEFQTWGPLHRTHHERCCPSEHGDEVVCSRADCQFAKPIKSRRGETFRAFVRRLELLGYAVEWRVLRASDYGAPTSRRRFFLVARRDGKPHAWPEPTHGPGRAAPHRTAGECIDWSVPCPSIFGRKKKHAAATLRRVARGAWSFVLNAAEPFVVTLRGGEDTHVDASACGLDEPLRTVSAGGTHHGVVAPYIVPYSRTAVPRSIGDQVPTVTTRDRVAVCVPYLVHRSNGERPGQAPRIYSAQEPIRTIVAQGQKQAACAAYLVKHYGGHENRRGGTALTAPADTITATDHHSLTTAELVAGGLTEDQVSGARRVATFLRDHGYDVGEFAVVTVAGESWVVVDLGMRMLTARELFRAQGFPDDYVIELRRPDGKPLTKTAQVRMCGNSVPPPIAAAIVRSQLGLAA